MAIRRTTIIGLAVALWAATLPVRAQHEALVYKRTREVIVTRPVDWPTPWGRMETNNTDFTLKSVNDKDLKNYVQVLPYAIRTNAFYTTTWEVVVTNAPDDIVTNILEHTVTIPVLVKRSRYYINIDGNDETPLVKDGPAFGTNRVDVLNISP